MAAAFASVLTATSIVVSVVAVASAALAQDGRTSESVGISNTLDPGKAERGFRQTSGYSPYAGRSFPTRPFFGDTHLHTSYSMDAGAFGARLDPRAAYRFARGEEVTSSSGQPVKLSRPLDFLVVADHSDNMGFFPDLFAGKPNILADPTGKKWYEMIKNGKGNEAAMEIIVAFSHNTFPKDIFYGSDSRPYKNAWHETIAAAE